jgi:outer membrane protein assembly factor BamC
MKSILGIFFLVIVFAVLAGCSYLQSYFPDKERDYQYTTEIPMMNWPAELRKNQAADGSSGISPTAVNPEQAGTDAGSTGEVTPVVTNPASSTEVTTPSLGTSNTSPVAGSEADEKDTVESIEIIKYDDGESRLRLGAGFSKSWRVISKALSHNSIEVTGRDHDKGLFTVQYDPDEKKAKDESLMDELSFIFHGVNSNEKEYQLKLEEHNQKTDVIVLDAEHLPLLNNKPALHLLKVLADTTKADLAEKNK